MNQSAGAAVNQHRASPDGAMPGAARIFVGLLKHMKQGVLTLRLPSGETMHFGTHPDEGAAELHISDWRACGAILKSGDIGFAHAYGNGWADSPDTTALIKLAMKNEAALATAVNGNLFGRLWYGLLHRLRRNTRAGSRRNIHAHYDIGNAFYRLWLDPTWTYSSALFDGDYGRTLQAAQEAKYQRIVERLGLQPGMRVLEIGCGWGGFALHAARLGVQVHGVTISAAQLQVAQERVREARLEALVQLELRDYRDLHGAYDAVVSIEMFEAVGEAYWPRYFDTVRRCLAPHGQALIQSITIADQRFADYRAGSDFVREYIFPGGMLPSPEAFSRKAAAHGLHVVDALAFGRDYAETLRRWRAMFESQLSQIRQQGFDDAFIRIWRLYYQYCEAGFDIGNIDVYQFHLQEAEQ